MAGRISLYVRLQKVTLYLSIKKRLRSLPGVHKAVSKKHTETGIAGQ